MKYIFVLAVVFLLASVNFCSGAPADFMPKFAWFGGDFEFEANYDRVGKDRNGKVSTKSLQGYREKLQLATTGYVYHPKLFYFGGDIALDLDQVAQKTEENNDSSQWRRRKLASEEYNFYGVFLGKNPLSLDFHISQERPFLTSAYDDSGQTAGVFGAEVNLQYKKKALFTALSYAYNDAETVTDATPGNLERAFNNVNNIISASFGYGGAGYSVSSNASHSETTVSGDISSAAGFGKETKDQWSFFSKVKYKKYVFDSAADVTYDEARDRESLRYMVKENIFISLPWKMDSRLNFSHDQISTDNYDVDGGLDDSLINKNNRVSGVLHHRLFDSVLTTIDANYQNNNTTTSRRVSQDYRISANYHKKLRGGGLGATVDNDLIRTEQQGTPFIDGERSDTDEVVRFRGDSVRLNRPDAQVASLVVEVFNTECEIVDIGCVDFGVDPITGKSGAWQSIPADQWRVADSGVRYLKIIFEGSPLDMTNSALYQQDFTPTLQGGPYTNLIRMSYFQPEADFIVQSISSSLYANITLFDDLFSAYYGHTATGQEYIEGDQVFGELASKVTEDELGMNLTKVPFDVDTSYRFVGSDLRNEKRWKLDAGYNQGLNLFSKIGVNWGLRYRIEELWEEDSVGTAVKSTESTFVARVGASSKIPYTPLTIAPGSTYTRHRGGVAQHEINQDGIWETLDLTTVEDTDIYANRVSLGMIIPYVNMKVNFFATYIIEDNFTTSRQIVTQDLGFSTGRSKSWVFGSTSITLGGAYELDSSKVETDNLLTGVLNNSDTVDSEFEITLTVRRILF